MSSIKPPSGKVPRPPIASDVRGATRTGASKAPSDTFKNALDDPGAVSSTGGAADVGRAEPATGVAAIAQDLRAGRIDAETALNKLVDKALAKADAAGLPPARRTELEGLLRDALASDPTLSQLSEDLERGR